jgi:hypothetical protein
MNARAPRTIIFVALAVCLHTGCRRGGEMSGQVTLKGTPPPEIQINLDPASTKLRPNGLTTRHYLVSSNGGLANVFVYIKGGLSNHTFAAPTEPVLMEFRGVQFEPYLIVVWTNQAVRFRNGDPILQNFHATPRATGNREFNFAIANRSPIIKEPWYWAALRFVLRQPRPSSGIDRAFAVPEPFIRVKCDVHPWEFGYICVVDHPFFAVTDAHGNFKFPSGLPPGKYTIEARHLKAGAATQEVVVASGAREKLEFALSMPSPQTRP